MYQSTYPGTKFTRYLCFFPVVRAQNEAFNVYLYIDILPERGIRNPVDHGSSLAHLALIRLVAAAAKRCGKIQLVRLKSDGK